MFEVRTGFTYSDNFVVEELAVDGGGLLALLDLFEGVTVLGDDALDLATVGGFLVELLAQFELDLRALESAGGQKGVDVSVLGQRDDRADSSAHFPRDEAHACAKNDATNALATRAESDVLRPPGRKVGTP